MKDAAAPRISQGGDVPLLASLVDQVELRRIDAGARLDPSTRGGLGQFMTPAAVARLMAKMFKADGRTLRILDPGAGVGSLTVAFLEELCGRKRRPTQVEVVAYEVDPLLAKELTATLDLATRACAEAGITVSVRVMRQDFIAAAVAALDTDLFSSGFEAFDCVVTNPPYRKINNDSTERRLLESINAGSPNLYTAFLQLSAKLLRPGGEMVAITPRSFCNGTYFRSFRAAFLDEMGLDRIHIFDSRDQAFEGDGVLQENVVFHATKGARPKTVELWESTSADSGDDAVRTVPFAQVVQPGDPDLFIRLVTDGVAEEIARRMTLLTHSLADLGLTVSTGRVVDFRAREHLRPAPGRDTAPLIYPGHFSAGFIQWPRVFRKPNALAIGEETEALLVPTGTYVLVKRFSSKEERRRVVAAIFRAQDVPGERIGFENHLNYFHRDGQPLPEVLARGLSAFLNSTILDEYFRQLSGHTQVNAGDLRNLKYPSLAQLHALGQRIAGPFPDQSTLDEYVTKELFPMSKTNRADPLKTKARIEQAIAILDAIGMPKEQLNERTGLVLLALLDLTPQLPWSEGESPLIGITPMMDFFRTHYGKDYAPNSRETVRRQSVHQLLDAGHILANPDDPARPTNSGKTVYQLTASALRLLNTFGTKRWNVELEQYLTQVEPLRLRYARERDMHRIPVRLPGSQTVELSPGGQNDLIKPIVEEFCARYTPGGTILYIGDTASKFAFFEKVALEGLGVRVGKHGKMPDVVVHYPAKNWLVLIEAVTSHGPVDAKRLDELKRLFKGSTAGLVFVTAFLDRQTLVKFLPQISWETEVWVADAPTHLIHFNGERFLGPYET